MVGIPKKSTFLRQINIIRKGWSNKEILENDIPKIENHHKAEVLFNELEKNWLEQTKNEKNPSLIKALLKSFGKEITLISFSYLVVRIFFIFLQTHSFRQLLLSVSADGITHHGALECVIYIIIANFTNSVLTNWIKFDMSLIGMKARLACSALIYKNMLGMKNRNTAEMDIGKITTLLSNDVFRMDIVAPFLIFSYTAPIEVICGLSYLTYVHGFTSFVGFATAIFFTAMNVWLKRTLTSDRVKIASKSEDRIKLLNDVISGIKVIKMYAWETHFLKLIRQKRKTETDNLRRFNQMRNASITVSFLFDKIGILIDITTAYFLNVAITLPYIFTVVNVYNQLKFSFFINFPIAIALKGDMMVSIQRIQDFLTAKNNQNVVEEQASGKPEININNVSFSYNKTGRIIFEKVAFHALPHETIAITGISGSGKTTLLNLILGELTPNSGEIKKTGIVSYASQEPWIFPGTVQENILFGNKMDKEKYLKIIRVCALDNDIEGFPHKDKSLVGERGVMLSGGQKARINLARAIYKEADFYLLDDPLSAVDIYVAQQIFNECIMGYLKDKGVILVTHFKQFKNNIKIYTIVNHKLKLLKHDDFTTENYEITDANSENIENEGGEAREVAEIKTSRNKMYFGYLSAVRNWPLIFICILAFLINQFVVNCSDFILSAWSTSQSYNKTIYNEMFNFHEAQNYLYTLMGVSVCMILTSLLVGFLIAKICLRVSVNLHEAMATKVIFSSISFFHNHPSGRILNRFSRDIILVDDLITVFLLKTLINFFILLSICLISCFTNYWVFLPTVLLIAICVMFSIIFQNGSRTVKKMEGINFSPILTHIPTTFKGLSTIRSLGGEKHIQEKYYEKQDLHTSWYYLYIVLDSAYAFLISMITSLYSSIAMLLVFFFASNIGNVSLVLSQLLQLYVSNMFLTSQVQLDIMMMSTDRILEYCNLKTETDNGTAISQNWPQKGSIILKNLTLKYGIDKQIALSNINLTIKAQDKIGIVGRTGAGKTSLISVLFRLFDFEGAVEIDGVDTQTIPLQILRSSMIIIPQDPVLFSGTLRQNLDPFNEHPDHELWTCLSKIKPEITFSNTNLTLDSIISDEGSNFSVGQRQLLCLVRAILRKRKIVILDEATSSVDSQTDELIQTLVRENFKESTVLTIAHRISTILDYDKILVMDKGRVVEFDSTKSLLTRDSLFYKMVNKLSDK